MNFFARNLRQNLRHRLSSWIKREDKFSGVEYEQRSMEEEVEVHICELKNDQSLERMKMMSVGKEKRI
jgi:hypothetical protein